VTVRGNLCKSNAPKETKFVLPQGKE
jgi:hypothetical protein